MTPSNRHSTAAILVFRRRVLALSAVASGGLLGSAVRVGVGEWIPAAPASFPVATLLVNLLGSFLLGVFLTRRERVVTGWRWSFHFWAIGAFGSLTTFATFGLDVVRLLDHDPMTALAYLGSSLLGGLLTALLGLRLGAVLR